MKRAMAAPMTKGKSMDAPRAAKRFQLIGMVRALCIVLALCLSAAACGSPETTTTAPETGGEDATDAPAPTTGQTDVAESGDENCPGPGEIEGEVVFGGVGGAPETIFLETLIPKFEEEYPGVTVTHVTGRTTAHFQAVEADPQGHGFDVVWLEQFGNERGKQAGLWQPNECIPEEENLFDQYKDPDGIGVQNTVAEVGLVYHTEALENAGLAPPTAWVDLLKPEYEGRVPIWEIPGAVGTLTLVALSIAQGGSVEDVEPGFEALGQLAEDGAPVFEAPAALEELLATESAWVAPSSAARAYQAIEAGLPLEYVRPSEGIVAITNYFQVPVNAPNPDAARAWVNFLIRADNLVHLVEGIFVSPVNREIELSPELSDTMIDSEEELSLLMDAPDNVIVDHLSDWTDRFNREVAG